MQNETAANAANFSIPAKRVYIMAAVCLVAGLSAGYLTRGTQTGRPAPGPAVVKATSANVPPHALSGHMPSTEEMKQMGDTKAAPLLEKLKKDPNNTSLLMQVGSIYHSAHQFKEAATWYSKAVEVDPKNVPARTKLAISLYRSGNVDEALKQLNQALAVEPHDPNALFNLGMIRLQGKRDNKGALAAWQKLLKTNPNLSPDQKAEVQKLMAEALTMIGDQHGVQRRAQ